MCVKWLTLLSHAYGMSMKHDKVFDLRFTLILIRHSIFDSISSSISLANASQFEFVRNSFLNVK